MSQGEMLKIRDENGSYIEEPFFYLMARMAYPDDTEELSVQQLYTTLVANKNHNSDLSEFEKVINKTLHANMRERKLAGMVIINLARMKSDGWHKLLLSHAEHLAAHQYREMFAQKSTLANAERSVRRGYGNFRSTSHFQAAMLLEPKMLDACGLSRYALGTLLTLSANLAQSLQAVPNLHKEGSGFLKLPQELYQAYHYPLEPLCDEEREVLQDYAAR